MLTNEMRNIPLNSTTRNELNKVDLKTLHLFATLNSRDVLLWVTLPLLGQLFRHSEILTSYHIAREETIFCFTELQKPLKASKL